MASKSNKGKQIEASEATAVLEQTKNLTIEKVVEAVGRVQTSTQKVLADLSATFSAQIAQSEILDKAIAIKEQRLRDLHQIEVQAMTLEELRAQEEEFKAQSLKGRQERQEQWSREEDERETEQARVEEEYQYATAQAHKKLQDEFNMQLETSKRAESLRKETLERGWAEREAVLKAREQEFAALQAQVAKIPEQIKHEVARAEAIISNTMKRNHEHELALLKKDSESAVALAKAENVALAKERDTLNATVSGLQTQLTAARADAKEVATKALESASSQKVTDALQNTIQSQSAAMGGGKR